uniref:Ribonuclease A-domain domain-containing protein n=1 Tax=Anabas testudineus TaxID=64144 RepID=A0A3Q1K5E3_ANATE
PGGIMKVQLICSLLVLLFVVSESTTTAAEAARRYKIFERQHIKKNMTLDQCDDFMKAVNAIEGGFKEKNTFIISDADTIQLNCLNPKMKNDIVETKNKYRAIYCELSSDGKYTGKEYYERLKISCKDNLPVHFIGVNRLL